MIKYEYIIISRPISNIKEYYNTCNKTVSDEIENIERQNENGYYYDYADYEGEFDRPLNRSDIIYFSTLNELNILCEKILRKIFNDNHNTNGRIDFSHVVNNADLIRTLNDYATLKLNSFEVNINDCLKFISEKYCIQFDSVEGYSVYIDIRNMINSYKHRDCIKHKIRKNQSIKFNMLEDKYGAYDLDINLAFEKIERFLLYLFYLTNTTNL